MDNPRDAANEAIRCIREEDIDGYMALFYGVDRSEVGPSSDETQATIRMQFDKKLHQLGSITEVSELRCIPSDDGFGGVAAYLREEDDKVFVVILRKKGDDYLLDDIYSPSHESYNSLKIFSENG